MSKDVVKKLEYWAFKFSGKGEQEDAASDVMSEALREVARQARHIEELREKIDAERSCACSFDAPGDVCAAHSPALTRGLAEVERLRAALIEWDALIKHQFSGTRDAMSDMQRAALNTKRILDELDAREALEAKP